MSFACALNRFIPNAQTQVRSVPGRVCRLSPLLCPPVHLCQDSDNRGYRVKHSCPVPITRPACWWHNMARKASLSVCIFWFICCCQRVPVYYTLQNELHALAKHFHAVSCFNHSQIFAITSCLVTPSLRIPLHSKWNRCLGFPVLAFRFALFVFLDKDFTRSQIFIGGFANSVRLSSCTSIAWRRRELSKPCQLCFQGIRLRTQRFGHQKKALVPKPFTLQGSS